MIGVEPITFGLEDQKVCKLQLLGVRCSCFSTLKNLGIRGSAQVREALFFWALRRVGLEPTIRCLVERCQFVSFFSWGAPPNS